MKSYGEVTPPIYVSVSFLITAILFGILQLIGLQFNPFYAVTVWVILGISMYFEKTTFNAYKDGLNKFFSVSLGRNSAIAIVVSFFAYLFGYSLFFTLISLIVVMTVSDFIVALFYEKFKQKGI